MAVIGLTTSSLHNAIPGIQHTAIKGTGHWSLMLDIFLRAL